MCIRDRVGIAKKHFTYDKRVPSQDKRYPAEETQARAWSRRRRR